MIKAKVVGLPEILAELEAVAHTFDLDKGDLGQKLMDIATFEVLASMDAEQTPDGLPWAPLSQKYLEYKLEIAPQAQMGVLFGVMKTWDQIAGERHVSREVASMTYGTDPAARIEAVKFTEGGAVTGTNQPGRLFFGLTHVAIAKITATLDQHFATAW